MWFPFENSVSALAASITCGEYDGTLSIATMLLPPSYAQGTDVLNWCIRLVNRIVRQESAG
jgi:hypothetical protein